MYDILQQQIKLRLKFQTKQLRLDTVSSRHEAKYYKTALRVHGSVRAFDSFACIGVGTVRGGNSKTCAFDTISI